MSILLVVSSVLLVLGTFGLILDYAGGAWAAGIGGMGVIAWVWLDAKRRK